MVLFYSSPGSSTYCLAPEVGNQLQSLQSLPIAVSYTLVSCICNILDIDHIPVYVMGILASLSVLS